MSLQARMSQGDPRLYNPNRDVAHCFEGVITEVANRCESGTWSVLTRMLKDRGVDDVEVGKACQALCRFIVIQVDVKYETMEQGMARAGFLDLHPTAQAVVMAYLGVVILGYHWAGVRESTLNGIGPALTYKGLRWHGYQCAKVMTLPRWKRCWYRWQRRFRAAWRVFWCVDAYTD